MAVLIGELRLRREDEFIHAQASEPALAPSGTEEVAVGAPRWPSQIALDLWPCDWPVEEDDSRARTV